MNTPFTGESTWNLETKIGLPIIILIALGCLALLVLGTKKWRSERESYSSDGWAIVAVWAGIFFLGFVIFSATGYYPYDKEHHAYYTVQGKVTDINKRLIADGKAMSERYVVSVDGQPFGVDDTRASLVKVGGTITLGCKKEWVYASTDGWACRWIDYKEN